MGIGPFGTDRDMVYLVEGATAPLILRDVEKVFIGDGHQFPFQVQSKNQFQFIGDAFVHGIIDGEASTPVAARSLCYVE